MRCPTDDTTLVMSERNGIEIDYCPDCRGVWLDRGELDKIIERASGPTPLDDRRPRYDSPSQHAQQPQQAYRKKRENWLSELFD